MKKIQLLNKIAACGTDVFDKNVYEVAEGIENPDAIMVRSASMHEMTFNPELRAIARAGAGVNNIPIEKCAEEGIVVFNTPGANANGVKELAIAALILAARDVVAVSNGQRPLPATPTPQRQSKRARVPTSVTSLQAKRSASSVSVPSAVWLPTPQPTSA